MRALTDICAIKRFATGIAAGTLDRTRT